MLTSNDTKIYAVNTEKYKENKSTGCVATRGAEEAEEPKNQAGLQSGGLRASERARGPLGRCSSPTNDRAGPSLWAVTGSCLMKLRTLFSG